MIIQDKGVIAPLSRIGANHPQVDNGFHYPR